MKVLAVLLVGAVMAIATNAISGRPTLAQEATPTQITDLGLDGESVLGLIGPTATISWQMTGGVDRFQLTATLLAIRVNRSDPFCTPPAQPDTTEIAIEQSFANATTEFAVTFPALPDSDAWFVYQRSLFLRAFAADGSQIGAEGGGFVSETLCPRTVPTNSPTAPIIAPATGFGSPRDDSPSTANLLLAALALFVAGAAVSTGARRR